MIVCMSRRICVALHNEIIKIRPHWHDTADDKGAIKVIMTGSASDPLDWQEHIRNKPRRKAIGDRLKDPKDSLKLVLFVICGLLVLMHLVCIRYTLTNQ